MAKETMKENEDARRMFPHIFLAFLHERTKRRYFHVLFLQRAASASFLSSSA